MKLPLIREMNDIIKLTEEYGFLPFFKNHIDGFSIEECCPGELWFSDVNEGPWDWKGPLAMSKKVVYGKFFAGKAGFVSLDMFPLLVNRRRDGYDFDARYEDGLANFKDKEIYETVDAAGSMLSKEIKRTCGYLKGGKKGFETVITRLQMQTYFVVENFEYMTDKNGREYGWGVARYTTPEKIFGYDFVTSAYKEKPLASYEKILLAAEKITKNRELAEKLLK